MSIAIVTTTSSTAVSLTTAIGIGVGGALIAILLVMLLSSRELITASSKRSRSIMAMLDAVIIPLLVVFALTIVFQVMEIVAPIA
ncbi:MAG: hypothetical protein A4E32_00737 [Methanomassiliicoccales archaeon PtaU1.Bin124]|nr:MAG: hypothetical protein A4E32_00737 [Methanomassiliicoccales archaeon PtaU1.Bin124]